MCQTALNVATGEEIAGMGDVRKIAQIIYWNGESGHDLPDESCLCWVNLPHTLVFAGYKVWLNPDELPEFLCEPVGKDGA